MNLSHCFKHQYTTLVLSIVALANVAFAEVRPMPNFPIDWDLRTLNATIYSDSLRGYIRLQGTNRGLSPVDITGVAVDCGCIEIRLKGRTVQSLANVNLEIEVAVNTLFDIKERLMLLKYGDGRSQAIPVTFFNTKRASVSPDVLSWKHPDGVRPQIVTIDYSSDLSVDVSNVELRYARNKITVVREVEKRSRILRLTITPLQSWDRGMEVIELIDNQATTKPLYCRLTKGMEK